jgi:hypothetical protein
MTVGGPHNKRALPPAEGSRIVYWVLPCYKSIYRLQHPYSLSVTRMPRKQETLVCFSQFRTGMTKQRPGPVSGLQSSQKVCIFYIYIIYLLLSEETRFKMLFFLNYNSAMWEPR